MSILIYGGLNEIGSKLTSFFLEEGIETWVVKSSYRDEQEEEEEMFYGRNALFKPIEANQRWGLDRHCSTACFAFTQTYTELMKNEALGHLERLLEEDQFVETMVLVVRDVNEESKEDPTKWGKKAALYKELEETFIKQVEKANNETEHVKLIVIRISDQIEPLRNPSYPHKRNTYGRRLAACIFEVIQLIEDPGIYFYEIKPKKTDQSLSKTSNEKVSLTFVKKEV